MDSENLNETEQAPKGEQQEATGEKKPKRKRKIVVKPENVQLDIEPTTVTVSAEPQAETKIKSIGLI